MWLCKRDLSKECKGGHNDCTDCILDEIRAEIINLTNGDIPERIWNVDVLNIIDRQKVRNKE